MQVSSNQHIIVRIPIKKSVIFHMVQYITGMKTIDFVRLVLDDRNVNQRVLNVLDDAEKSKRNQESTSK